MQNRRADVKRLLDVAAEKSHDARDEQAIINTMNSKEAKEALKLTGWYDYVNINRAYVQARYGKYALMGTLFAATGFYVGSLLLAPTLFPFALAAITTVWLKWTLAAVVGAAAAYTGFNFLKSSWNEVSALFARAMNTIAGEKNHNQKLSNQDIAVLATIALAGAGFVGMMYLMPALLPVVGTLGTWSKLGVAAAAVATVTAPTSYAAYKGFFNKARTADRPVEYRYDADEPQSEVKHDELNPFVIVPKGL